MDTSCFLPTFGNPDSKVNRTTTKKNDQAFSIRKLKARVTSEQAQLNRRRGRMCFSKEFFSSSYGKTGYRADSRQHGPPSGAYVPIREDLCLSNSKETAKARTMALSPQAVTVFHLDSLCLLLLCILSQKTLNNDPAGLGGQTSPDKDIMNLGVHVCSRLRVGHLITSPAFPFSG